MKSGLAALMNGVSLEELLGHFEKNEPFFGQCNQENIKSLTQLPFLSSLDSLLQVWPHSIQAHLPDLRDEASSIDTTAKDALKLFRNGMGLLFNEAQTLSPILVEWLNEIRRDLGLSHLTYGRCLLYATPDGKGTAPHFDQNYNFVIQIHGTKKWTMAPNQHVLHPLTRHTMGQTADSELASYLEGPLPTSMPSEALTYELTPGSILFVPRGYWHATKAQGNALALNFTFTAPTWIDLFTVALRSRLSQVPQWRETANGLTDPEHQTLSEKKFDYLLSTLAQEMPHWRASDILNVTEFES